MNHGTPNPAPQGTSIFVWHQGALGDVLLAGPALQAVARHYPAARLTLAGTPATLDLLRASLPVAAVWDSRRVLWLDLFQSGGEISSPLRRALAGFDLALVFTPAEPPEFLHRLRQAGIPRILWLPSFPLQARLPIGALQARSLAAAGLPKPRPFRLTVPEAHRQEARAWLQTHAVPGPFRAALAPGSGHPRKNWPLEHYLRLARDLSARNTAQVWWLLGPAEAGLLPELRHKLPNPDLRLLTDLPLPQLAARLAEFDLYVGNDSGVTHLAAALDGPAVTAIFGPSDPLIWAPPGERTLVVAPNLPCAPCTSGREILCPEPVCLSSLTPEAILAALSRVFPNHG